MITQMNFTKDANGRYVASFTVNDAIAVHIERETSGSFEGQMSSLGAEQSPIFVPMDNLSGCCHMGKAIDFELVYAIYPKVIKFISATPVTRAYIIS